MNVNKRPLEDKKTSDFYSRAEETLKNDFDTSFYFMCEVPTPKA